MPGSIYGNLFRVATFGESHGRAIGAVIDGCPAGLSLSEEDIQADLDRRKPGQSIYATQRMEGDNVEIVSGVFEGVTTGTPIGLLIYNRDQKSGDYSHIKDVFRPGHGDFGFYQKYRYRDYRGGGRSSGRETAARVAGGAVARKILSRLGVAVTAYIIKIGEIEADTQNVNLPFARSNPLCMPDRNAYEKAAAFLDQCREMGDSAGAVVQCVITGLKPGFGEPVFDKLDADLAKGIFSIGGVKGVEIGKGFPASEGLGSENNDGFQWANGKAVKRKNDSGGILGGLSDSGDIMIKAAFKPTPSISKPQKTANTHGENVDIEIRGRHDPIIAPRAVVVVEAMASLTIVNHILAGLTCRMNLIEKGYQNF